MSIKEQQPNCPSENLQSMLEQHNKGLAGEVHKGLCTSHKTLGPFISIYSFNPRSKAIWNVFKPRNAWNGIKCSYRYRRTFSEDRQRRNYLHISVSKGNQKNNSGHLGDKHIWQNWVCFWKGVWKELTGARIIDSVLCKKTVHFWNLIATYFMCKSPRPTLQPKPLKLKIFQFHAKHHLCHLATFWTSHEVCLPFGIC